MEYALVRVLGDAVDPGLIPILVTNPALVLFGLCIIAVGAFFAIKVFFKKNKKGK